MSWSSTSKLLQKKTYDILSHRYGTVCVICGVLLVIVSAFQFGEAAMEWSREKYAAVFNSFSDNLAGKSYRNRLCLPVPIDVVYTWVNGTDPMLLRDLHDYKLQLQVYSNYTNETECTFANCAASFLVVMEPAMPPTVTAENLSILYPAFKPATRVFQVVGVGDGHNITVAEFSNIQQVSEILQLKIRVDNKNVTIRRGFFTTDKTITHSFPLEDIIYMTGFPHTMEEEKLKATIPEKYHKSMAKFELYSEKGFVLIKMTEKSDFEALLHEKNITIDSKEPTFTQATLVWDLKDDRLSEDIAANRFVDNEELRYSLRSLERFAPWVRHVYIVTNGQIPSWMNLDCPRMTLITHEELFPNMSDLPTFSSPAIESHLHRIPGLSDKFLYLNDDVMFGNDVWPDDFYTHAHGQKVYLTWSVPNCQEGCPSTWIRDGYCDKACNNSDCEWDGGDCTGEARNMQWGADRGGIGGAWNNWQQNDALYCNSGCANNWLADRYCDTACNTYLCGFDAGDCGTDKYDKMYELKIESNTSDYHIPKGKIAFFVNLTLLFGSEGKAEEGKYDDNDIIRSVAIAQKFHVATVVMAGGKNATKFTMQISGKDKSEKYIEKNLTVFVDTRIDKGLEETEPALNETKVAEGIAKEDKNAENVSMATNVTEIFEFDEIPQNIRAPKVLYIMKESEKDVHTADIDMSYYDMPENIADKYKELRLALQEGELTDKGFARQQRMLWNEMVSQLKQQGQKPKIAEFRWQERPEKLEDGIKEVKEMDNKDEIGKAEEVAVEHEPQKELENINNVVKGAAIQMQQGENVQNDGANQADKIQSEQKDAVQNADEVVQPAVRAMKVTQPTPVVIGEKILHEGKDNEGAKDAGYKLEEGVKSRKLQAVGETLGDNTDGFLPWEQQGFFKDVQKEREKRESMASYNSGSIPQRRLLDTFGDSLRHVNKIYNSRYGYTARKVPAHMPHMIDRHIMTELQAQFPEEWADTSSHKVRHSRDMQYAFSYFYYLMSEPVPFSALAVFKKMDTDHSGVLSDREVRTFATRLYDLPLDLQTLTGLEAMFSNCSRHLPPEPNAPNRPVEHYYVKEMPQLTEYLFVNCPEVVEVVKKKFPAGTKYTHEVVSDDQVGFKMIRTNVSSVVGQLDDLRKHPKKFICLNDNIDHKNPEAKTVQAILADFYESILPIQSDFELPREYRNRFTHIDELREWRKYRDWLKLWTQVALVVLVIFTIGSFLQEKLEAVQRRFFGRRDPLAGNKTIEPV